MSHSRKNTLVFWCNKKNTDCFGGGNVLYSIDEAKAFIQFNKKKDSLCGYLPVTLTDDQLAKITDKNSTLKPHINLEQFNPFSPEGINYKKALELFETQKMTFALGLFLKDSKNPDGQKNESPLKSAFAKNSIFDTNPIKENLFPFLEPTDPFTLKTSTKKT